MSAPLPQPEIYRVFNSLDALKEVFLDRIDDLNVPLTEVDAAGGMTRGNMQKCLSTADAKWAREFGWKTLQAACKGTGLILAAIVDDERFAPIKAEMATRKLKQRAMLRQATPNWLFTPQKARKLAKKRWEDISKEERSKIMKKVRKAAKAKHRRRQRESAAAGQERAAA